MVKKIFAAVSVVDGQASGRPLVLEEPLSLWGGLDPQSGQIIDQRHPQVGEIVTGRVLILPSGRGSSSASSILLEALKSKTAPAAIITAEMDGILALGAVVAQEIYDTVLPVVTLGIDDYRELCELAAKDQPVTVHGSQVEINS